MASPPSDPNESVQPGIYAAEITCYVLCVIAVVLRFIARKVGKQGFWWDDWWILAALLLNSAYFGSAIEAIKLGMGRHEQTLSNETLFKKEGFAVNALYAAALSVTRFSVIAFYWRIFGVSKGTRIFLRLLAFATLAWGLSLIFVSTFECTPIKLVWDKTATGHCANAAAFFFAIVIVNLVIDVILLIAPLPHILGLKQSLGYRVAVYAIFLLGGFTCVISIIRLVILGREDFHSPDFSWNDAIFFMWCGIETGVSIVAACLPSYKPLLHLIAGSKQPFSGPTGESQAITMVPSNGSVSKSKGSITSSNTSSQRERVIETMTDEKNSVGNQTNRSNHEAYNV